jgi:hypothetical protein
MGKSALPASIIADHCSTAPLRSCSKQFFLRSRFTGSSGRCERGGARYRFCVSLSATGCGHTCLPFVSTPQQHFSAILKVPPKVIVIGDVSMYALKNHSYSGLLYGYTFHSRGSTLAEFWHPNTRWMITAFAFSVSMFSSAHRSSVWPYLFA